MVRTCAGGLLVTAIGLLVLGPSFGCRHRMIENSPAASGFNTRDLIDPASQAESEELTPIDQLAQTAELLRKERQKKLEEQSKKEGGAAVTKPKRNVLCLSGGGSFGAYSAGVLVGWSERGDRPQFDVVTGISTGALIAPFAFLGPKYDPQLKRFYTELESRDLYRLRPLRALVSESFADTSPMAAQIDGFLTPEAMADLAEAHRQGRRLYIGTTEEEGKQFVVWDLGAMAARNGPGDRALMKKVLLGSAAPAGFFPAAKIDVTVNGQVFTERHVDGGVSQSVFFRPPYVAPEQRSDVAARDLAGTKVYVIVAGKLYADPEVIQPWSLAQAGKSVSTLIYAQTRGDLQRLYTICLLTGMDYYVSAIPQGYPAPLSSTEFKPKVMTAMFEEGRRVVASSEPWRTLPPGVGPGESTLSRAGPWLTFQQRGPILPISGRKGLSVPPQYPVSDRGSIPAGPLQPPEK
ncbi:Patatin-like phospholipase [Gemmata sp. SH-PL17]|uniref:patatin-like phospholipase family protein n=1 Tax=Gemmata sp. SH-PL17 TaxID=1630693 RepID=UPI0004B31682|nr:patatin-like phospholipase family protein [Gemmata sp. SH-PL17]AMV27444.1 Patatin-like phospholipase [Gemmata sp. SH-PL17]